LAPRARRPNYTSLPQKLKSCFLFLGQKFTARNYVNSTLVLLFFLMDTFFTNLLLSPEPYGMRYPNFFDKKIPLFSFNRLLVNTYPQPCTKFLGTNLVPHLFFNYTFFKKVTSFYATNTIYKNFVPIFHNTLVRFLEYCSGKKILIQFYPFFKSKYIKIGYNTL